MEEAGLAAPRDDDIEVMEPIIVLVRPHLPSDEIVHHHIGIVPKGIGHHKELLPALAEVLEHGHEGVVIVNVLLRLPRHGLLERAVPVAKVYGRAHVDVELVVALGLLEELRLAIFELHQLREEVRLGEGEEGVDERVLGLVEVLAAGDGIVDALALPSLQLPEAVVGHLDVLVAVQLEYIAALFVNGQPTDHISPVELEVQHDLGVPHDVHQLLHRLVVRKHLECLGAVLREGVVHVESDGGDAVHVEGAVAEDAALGGYRLVPPPPLKGRLRRALERGRGDRGRHAFHVVRERRPEGGAWRRDLDRRSGRGAGVDLAPARRRPRDVPDGPGLAGCRKAGGRRALTPGRERARMVAWESPRGHDERRRGDGPE
mmetsp:Transcript_29428/g.94220  ORF Transcript_29428/g.94220 Transcript_29428/m.94220 type:complete len:374 (+) Transcript_29428:136-1257(+)